VDIGYCLGCEEAVEKVGPEVVGVVEDLMNVLSVEDFGACE
jgi:hypothetical protein